MVFIYPIIIYEGFHTSKVVGLFLGFLKQSTGMAWSCVEIVPGGGEGCDLMISAKRWLEGE